MAAFTINQHYLSHITFIIRNLGPLRLISARPLERLIGLINKRIKSPSKPGENAANEVLNHYRLSNSIWQSDDEKPSIRFLETTFEAMNSMFPEVAGGVENILKTYYQVNNIRVQVSSTSTIKLINDYIIQTSQVFKSIKLTRGENRPEWIIVHDSESICNRNGVKLKLCLLKKMFIWNNTSLGLAQVPRCVLFDVSKKIHYFNRHERDMRWELISLKKILNYAILIDSIAYEHRTYFTTY